MKMEKGAPKAVAAAAPVAETAAPVRPRRRRSSMKLAMGAAAEAYGEMARTRPMRAAVMGSYLVIWGFVALLGILVLT